MPQMAEDPETHGTASPATPDDTSPSTHALTYAAPAQASASRVALALLCAYFLADLAVMAVGLAQPGAADHASFVVACGLVAPFVLLWAFFCTPHNRTDPLFWLLVCTYVAVFTATFVTVFRLTRPARR